MWILHWWQSVTKTDAHCFVSVSPVLCCCCQYKAQSESEIRELTSSHRLEVSTLRADIGRLTNERATADALANSHQERAHVR